MMKKKVTAMLLSIALILSLSIPAFAADGSSPISFEEYTKAIELEFAKYGLEGGVVDPEDSFYCTQDLLDADLQKIREYAATSTKQTTYYDINSTANDFNPIRPMAMYYDTTLTNNTFVNLPTVPILPAFFTVDTTVTFRVDAQNGYIVSAGAPQLEITSGTMVDDWIELTSYSHNINNTLHRVTTNITCKVKVSISVGVGTIWSKETANYVTTFYPV